MWCQLSARVLWLLLTLIDWGVCLRLLIPPGGKRCLRHESHPGEITNGNYDASEPDTHQLDILIQDAEGHMLYMRENIAKGTFAFSTENFQLFEVCVRSRPMPGATNLADREFFLEIKQGAEAKNFDLLAKAEKLKPMEMELKRLEALTDEIVRDFTTMHTKSSAMRSTNESTHTRVLYLSVLSMLILVSFAVWQVLYLRRYFKSKKLIE
ncbi:hypothetical protein CRM22_009222 [Opisthorchis felineus]|uniref:GOLD domain-containing protein n=1 Tax=Opisthorchis felineus TaxID=147828 RepID=A0A4S2LFM3_OPIFE|nr:hypothetical protein CRM22_009222 [Opisthorchis felineus]